MRGFGLEAGHRGLPLPRLSYSACLRSSVSCVHVYVRCTFDPLSLLLVLPFSPFSLRGALDTPFYRHKEMSSCTMGCSLELTWLAGMCPEPCTNDNVVVGGAP
jgi:hypothetical protein